MRKMNCDAANKLVRQLQCERDALIRIEAETSTYSYMAGEDPVVPEYDFLSLNSRLRELTSQIISIKHAINVFNTSTELPEVGLTIDGALVKMTMLNSDKSRLDRMRHVQKKIRNGSTARGVSEYTERNYNSEDAERKYQETCMELVAIQQAIDMANLTRTFDVNI